MIQDKSVPALIYCYPIRKLLAHWSETEIREGKNILQRLKLQSSLSTDIQKDMQSLI